MEKRYDHCQDTYTVSLEIVCYHLTRGYIAEAFAQHPLALEVHHTCKRNGDGVEGGIYVQDKHLSYLCPSLLYFKSTTLHRREKSYFRYIFEFLVTWVRYNFSVNGKGKS